MRLFVTSPGSEEALRAGTLRSDLYYRLNVVSILVPPLRERADDIPVLAIHFLEQCARKYGKPIRGISEEALGLLRTYTWPGNVRELQNVIERAVTFTAGDFVTEVELPRQGVVRAPGNEALSLEQHERVRILESMTQYRWNRRQTAAALGISRTTLWRRLKDYGMS